MVFMARRGVFKIINLRTGKVYIGSSNTNMDNLIYSYWQKLYSGNHHNNELQQDFNYYGRSNFTVEIVSGSCYSEGEVRSLRNHEIYINRHNTYNEDVPVHYGGGNPGASFGGYHGHRNNIMDDLIGIIDKSNLTISYKDKLKSSVRTGSITTESQLNDKISYYKKENELLDILEKSDLKTDDKYEIKYHIINGDIHDNARLNREITFYRNAYKLIDVLYKSDLELEDKQTIESEIKNKNISDEVRLNKEINFYHRAYRLIDILNKSDLKSSFKNKLVDEIKKRNITSESKLNDEIKVYEILSRYDRYTIKRLADQYCSFSNYIKWTQNKDKIIFKSNYASKTIHLDSLQKEIDLLKQDALNSRIVNSKFNAEELAEIIKDILKFNSYELMSKNVFIFDNKYKLEFTMMEKLYYKFDLTEENKFKTNESTINNFLRNRVNADNFNNTLENSIIEYCEIKKIAFWDLISPDTVLLYETNLNLISTEKIIEFLDSNYKELNLKLMPWDLRNVYHAFRRFANKPSDGQRDSVDRLLSILKSSGLTVDTKIEVKNDINQGKIYSESSLNDKINSLMKRKSKTSRRKIVRTSVNNDSESYNQHDNYKKENRNTGTSQEALEKLYEIYGYQFCASCGKKIPKFMDLCGECSKKQNNGDSQNATKDPEEALEKLFEIYGYQFCASCGKKIPKFMDLCEECSKNQD